MNEITATPTTDAAGAAPGSRVQAVVRQWIDEPSEPGWWLFAYEWWSEPECVHVYLGEDADDDGLMYVSRVPSAHPDTLVTALPPGAKWMKIDMPNFTLSILRGYAQICSCVWLAVFFPCRLQYMTLPFLSKSTSYSREGSFVYRHTSADAETRADRTPPDKGRSC